MAFVVVYDACVLFPAPLRDLLVRLALTGTFRARWSAQILDECFHGIGRHRPDLTPLQLERSRTLLARAIPDVEVWGHEALIPRVTGLPDPGDRHVVAAAIRAGAQVIVTANLRDFPPDALAPFGIEAQPPDMFVEHLVDLYPPMVEEVVREQAAALRSPPQSYAQLLETLERQGLARSVALLRGR